MPAMLLQKKIQFLYEKETVTFQIPSEYKDKKKKFILQTKNTKIQSFNMTISNPEKTKYHYTMTNDK